LTCNIGNRPVCGKLPSDMSYFTAFTSLLNI
jgi:hypothetical protein